MGLLGFVAAVFFTLLVLGNSGAWDIAHRFASLFH